MGNLNYQDVIRDVHDPVNHSLQISGSITANSQATVTLYGTPTIYAVVNTAAGGDSINNIGFATVAVSTPTLYAVVNTSAPGVGNSIVTVANLPLSTLLIGNVTLSDSKTYIGLVSVSHAAWTNPNTFIGLVTAVPSTTSRSIVGNVTISDSKGFIGLTSVSGTVGLSAGVAGIGFATVAVSTPTLYAVVNTGAVGITNSIVTVANTVAVTFSGNVTLSDAKTYIGLVSVSGSVNSTLQNSVNNVGFMTIYNGTAWSDPKVYIGLASVNIGGTLPGLSASPAFIGIVTITNRDRSIVGNVTLSDSKTYIGLTSVSGTVGLSAGIAGIGFATVQVASIATGTNAIGKLLPPDVDVTAHTNYARKYYTYAGAVTDGIIWSPAAGKRWHVVTMYIQVSAAATVTLEDDKAAGDDPVWKAELAANSGVVLPFTEQYPMASGEDAADLTVTTSAGNIYVSVVGYEI